MGPAFIEQREGVFRRMANLGSLIASCELLKLLTHFRIAEICLAEILERMQQGNKGSCGSRRTA